MFSVVRKNLSRYRTFGVDGRIRSERAAGLFESVESKIGGMRDSHSGIEEKNYTPTRAKASAHVVELCERRGLDRRSR